MRKIFTLSILVTIAVLVPHLLKSEGNVEPEGTNVTSKSTPASMVLIPAGKFRMGSSRIEGYEASKPIHSVHLDAFYMDTHEVTVGEYRRFIKESGHKAPPWDAISKISETDRHPIVGVNWYDAMAYAKWAGKRLPTEAEWEKAARGGLMDQNYPWGDEEPDSSLVNLEGRAVVVGSHEPNAFGLYDMGGNVAEWCLDPWDKDFYKKNAAFREKTGSSIENPFAGPKSLQDTLTDFKTAKGRRVIRGGSFTQKSSGSYLVGARYKTEAKAKGIYIGFRCVKDPSP